MSENKVWIALPAKLVRERSSYIRPEVEAELSEVRPGEWRAITHTKGDVDCVFYFDSTAELLSFVTEHKCSWAASDEKGCIQAPADQSALSLLAHLS